jgi:hypothetical protein
MPVIDDDGFRNWPPKGYDAIVEDVRDALATACGGHPPDKVWPRRA